MHALLSTLFYLRFILDLLGILFIWGAIRTFRHLAIATANAEARLATVTITATPSTPDSPTVTLAEVTTPTE